MIKWINKKRNKKGFTLIELIVVIAILGILAAIAIPRFAGVQDGAAKSTHNANVRTIESAANLYIASHGNPSTTYTMDQVKTYLNEVPKVPKGLTNIESGAPAVGAEYTVTVSADGTIAVAPKAQP